MIYLFDDKVVWNLYFPSLRRLSFNFHMSAYNCQKYLLSLPLRSCNGRGDTGYGTNCGDNGYNSNKWSICVHDHADIHGYDGHDGNEDTNVGDCHNKEKDVDDADDYDSDYWKEKNDGNDDDDEEAEVEDDFDDRSDGHNAYNDSAVNAQSKMIEFNGDISTSAKNSTTQYMSPLLATIQFPFLRPLKVMS